MLIYYYIVCLSNYDAVKFEFSHEDLPDFLVKICEFAINHDKEGIESILDDGFSINAKSRHLTAITWLTYNGNRAAVLWLISLTMWKNFLVYI